MVLVNQLIQEINFEIFYLFRILWKFRKKVVMVYIFDECIEYFYCNFIEEF